MRYLFRGLKRETGEPVDGRLVALGEDAARDVLGQHGIAVISVRPESSMPGDGTSAPFDEALEDALREAGVRIRFDQLPRWHEGRGIWVLDRDRIRDRVMRLVNEAIGHDGSRRHLQTRIAQVLEALFEAPRSVGTQPSTGSLAIAGEVDRLAAALARIEKAMASMSVAARGEPRRALPQRAARARNRARDQVLTEIFVSNLELMRAIGGPA